MATDLSGSNYSETDASNNNASPNGMPEGMAPSGVNDSWRQGMGAVKRAYDRDHAGSWCTVGGTANAITLTYSVGPASYVQGEKFTFYPTATNTAATTINVNGLGAKNIFKRMPGASIAACVGGEIQFGDLVEAVYDGTQVQIVGKTPSQRAWAAVGSTGTVLAGSNVASVTHGGTGVYTVNFTTALPDANYAVSVTATGGAALVGNASGLTTAGFGVGIFTSNGPAATDGAFSVLVFR